MHISDIEEQMHKKSFVCDIMAFENVVLNSKYCCGNICHRQLRC